jgi:hypothetical protein
MAQNGHTEAAVRDRHERRMPFQPSPGSEKTGEIRIWRPWAIARDALPADLCPVAGPFAAAAGPLFGFKAVDVLWVSTGFFVGVIAFRPEIW